MKKVNTDKLVKQLSQPAKKIKLRISTWLPIFNGYYGNYWQDLLEIPDYEIEERNRERNKLLPPLAYDNYQIDYQGASEKLAKDIFNVVVEYMEELNLVACSEFEMLRSPKYYNFDNDAIDVIFELNQGNIDTIVKYITEHFEQWKVFLKERYTSRDGFSSFYSPNVEDWNTLDCLKDKHKAGQVLNFILLSEDITEEMIYERVFERFSIDGFITITEPEVSPEIQEQIDNEIIDPNQLSLDI